MEHYDAVENQEVDIIYNLTDQNKVPKNLKGATVLVLNYKTEGVWSSNPATILDEDNGRLLSQLPANILKPPRLECYFEGVDIVGKKFEQLFISSFKIRALKP